MSYRERGELILTETPSGGGSDPWLTAEEREKQTTTCGGEIEDFAIPGFRKGRRWQERALFMEENGLDDVAETRSSPAQKASERPDGPKDDEGSRRKWKRSNDSQKDSQKAAHGNCPDLSTGGSESDPTDAATGYTSHGGGCGTMVPGAPDGNWERSI